MFNIFIISIYLIFLIGYFLTEYTKIIKNEKIRKRVNIICHTMAWFMLLYYFVIRRFI